VPAHLSSSSCRSPRARDRPVRRRRRRITGIEQALGRHVDIAVNHDPEAVSLHQANHPQTKHFVSDVFEVDPVAVTDGRPVGLLWASPDCKHFSKAKGGKPVEEDPRPGVGRGEVGQAGEAARHHLENVEEFQTWGPLLPNGRVCPIARAAPSAPGSARSSGWATRSSTASCAPATTARRRSASACSSPRARRQPIVWPEPTHGSGRPEAVAHGGRVHRLVDPVPEHLRARAKPLVDATLRRIAHGLKRYVIDAAKPFIVPVTHQGDDRVHPIDEPLRTVTSARSAASSRSRRRR
jgi:DNA (cytosine-5)-methyltransferase 1